ncbi:MAG: caspase family protein, partial [Magnetococcales bacterium]|nr:caspase family protein [Magnetococcales bacterium]
LPHEIWPHRGNIDDQQEVLDDFIRTLPPLANWSKRSDAYALLIGASRYKKMPGRHFADRDVMNLRQLLVSRSWFMDDAQHIRQRLDHEVTQSALQWDIDWLITQGRTNPNAMLLFYYSGHGLLHQVQSGREVGREAMLLPIDADPEQLTATTGYPLSRLKAELSKLPNKEIVVILDACFNQSSACATWRPTGGGGQQHGGGSPTLFGGKPPWLVAAVNSGALPYPPGRQSGFSYFLMRGLLGEADGLADGKRDGWVDMAEAFQYARDRLTEKHLTMDPLMTAPARLRISKIGGER